jgi:hypothetical protein
MSHLFKSLPDRVVAPWTSAGPKGLGDPADKVGMTNFLTVLGGLASAAAIAQLLMEIFRKRD